MTPARAPEHAGWIRQVAPRQPPIKRRAERAEMRLSRMSIGSLGAVGGPCELLGGIGVDSLVAVAERKGRSGCAGLSGARRADIGVPQFLVESTILSLAGGAIGAGLSFAATWGICRFAGWAFAVSAEGAVLGTAVAAGAGVFFGFYPAWQAARLNPVAALRG